MSDGLLTLCGLFGIAAGPSNAGVRKDNKVCTAKPGECRYNSKYYALGMGDAKSWSETCADESCPDACCYLRDDPVKREPEEVRRQKAWNLVEGILWE